jgi:thioesterase domain-containing protein/acyl carrier protein
MKPAHPEKASSAELEAKILLICRQLLRAEDFSVTDNFFDAGGHSLLAMELMLQIETQTGSKTSLETIFTAPTVRELCASIHKSDHRKPAVVLPVRSGSPQRSLYFTHSAFDFSALSAALAGDISINFVTINDIAWLRELVSTKHVLGAIDRISDSYAEAITAKRRGESYYLAGHSFGGILALETACKLEGRGDGPDIVFLFDTYLHSSGHRVLYDILHNGWLTEKIQQVLRGDRRELARRALSSLRKTFNRSASSAIHKKVAARSPAELGIIFRDLRDEASRIYRGPSRALTSRTVLFRATRSLGGRSMKSDPDLGWARILGNNLTIVPTPGDHFNLLGKDGASFIASEIDRKIGR